MVKLVIKPILSCGKYWCEISDRCDEQISRKIQGYLSATEIKVDQKCLIRLLTDFSGFTQSDEKKKGSI